MKLALRGSLARFYVVTVITALMLALPAFAHDVIQGVVAETMNSGVYTYVLLDHQGVKEWFAVPAYPVGVGDEIEILPGAQMGAFTSKTLGRTFERIVFSPGISGVLKPASGTAVASRAPLEVKVPKAGGPGAYTIADIFKNKDALNGKPAVVRGKVVKVVRYGGRQWLRLIDGTGSSKRGNHKLVVTTTQSADVDDVVTARGTVVAGKTLGTLRYEVIVENATLEKMSR